MGLGVKQLIGTVCLEVGEGERGEIWHRKGDSYAKTLGRKDASRHQASRMFMP